MGMKDYTRYMMERDHFKGLIRETVTDWFDNREPSEFHNGNAASCLRQLADELDEIHQEQEGR